jgi:hypothetical protein
MRKRQKKKNKKNQVGKAFHSWQKSNGACDMPCNIELIRTNGKLNYQVNHGIKTILVIDDGLGIDFLNTGPRDDFAITSFHVEKVQ